MATRATWLKLAGMKLLRIPDLTVSFQSDDRLLLRCASRGLGARVPAFAVAILAACSEPRAEEEIAAEYGPGGAALYRNLAAAGFLVEPDEASETSVFFANFADIDVHRRMLADEARVDAFARAIERIVRPGMVVLDAGTGSGLLACLAARAGARRVYAVDRSEVLDLAGEVVRASGLDDVVELVRGDFARVELPNKVDVIVTETVGAFALAEGSGPDLVACAERHLAPGGVVIPGALELWMAPVSDHQLLRATREPFAGDRGVDLSVLRPSAMRRARTEALDAAQLLCPGARLVRLDWPDGEPPRGSLRFESLPPGRIVGLAGWFVLELCPEVVLSTAPDATLTHWKQTYFPLDELEVAGGETLALEVSVDYASDDRRGLEVRTDWSLGDRHGRAWHRVR